MTSIYCNLIDRPRHPLKPDIVQEGSISGNVADAKSRNGILLGHAMNHDDIRQLCRLLWRDKRLESEWRITGIKHKDDVLMLTEAFHQLILVYDRTRRIIRIAEPHHLRTLRYLVECIDGT